MFEMKKTLKQSYVVEIEENNQDEEESPVYPKRKAATPVKEEG
jgi:hypothetical protein